MLWRDEQSLTPLGHAFRQSTWERDGFLEGMFTDGTIRGFGRLALSTVNLYVPTPGTLYSTFVQMDHVGPDSAG